MNFLKLKIIKIEQLLQKVVIHLEFDYPLYLGMLAIFIYVEVTIISNLPALLHTVEFGRILEDAVPPFIALYWEV
jgi:FHS family L-fucose permease-like MFS transporter